MKEKNFLTVLDSIHQAALNPVGWNDVLRKLAALTGCVAGGLTVERPATRQGVPLTYFGFDPGHVERAFDHYLPMNPLFSIESRMQQGFVVTNEDVVALDVFRQSEFYNGWARPQGLCSPITLVIHRTADSYVPLTLVRPDGAGGATPSGRALLSRLAPHLVHAMDVAVRLQAANCVQHNAAMTLEALQCGAVLVDRAGRIIFANESATRLFNKTVDAVIAVAGNKIMIRQPEPNRRFQAELSLALGLGLPAKGSQVSVPCPGGKGTLIVSLSPLPPIKDNWSALGAECYSLARCLILIHGTETAKLGDRYGLTPAETRVLAAITVGKGLTAAARNLGIARSTAQSHLDKIFQKTGTNRQAELVALANSGSNL